MKKMLPIAVTALIALSMLSILSVTDASSSEPPVTEWSRTYGGTNDEYTYSGSLVEAGDGGYAVAGYTESFGAGSGDSWLVKTNSTGHMQWNKTYGGTRDDRAYSVVQTADGGYALAGFTWSFGPGAQDFWLVKTNSTGHEQWNRTYGGTTRDQAHSMVQTADGGYALAGFTGPEHIYDFWLVKTDSTGTHQWNKTYGGTNSEISVSVVEAGDGGYAIAGDTYSFGAGDSDAWLVKTDSDGNMEWSQTYGGTNHDTATSVMQTSDGGYTMAGWTDSFGAGGTDVWLIKLAPVEIPSPTQLSVDAEGAHDYLPWENVKVKIWALVADVNTMEPVSDANVTITIYDPEDNLWISDTMTEKLNHGIYLWQSNQTVRQIFLHHKKGVYLVHVEASHGDGPTATDILTFHIDPPPEEDNQLTIVIGTTITSIAILAVAILYIIKKQSP